MPSPNLGYLPPKLETELRTDCDACYGVLWHLSAMENNPPPSEKSSSTIALVAPAWLQEALQVLLDGTQGVLLIASAENVDSLTKLEMEGSPDFVLLDADRDSAIAVSEVKRINHAWPKTDCIVLVDNTRQILILKDVGVSLTLLKGASPKRLREVLQVLAVHKLHSQIAFRPMASRL